MLLARPCMPLWTGKASVKCFVLERQARKKQTARREEPSGSAQGRLDAVDCVGMLDKKTKEADRKNSQLSIGLVEAFVLPDVVVADGKFLPEFHVGVHDGL